MYRLFGSITVTIFIGAFFLLYHSCTQAGPLNKKDWDYLEGVGLDTEPNVRPNADVRIVSDKAINEKDIFEKRLDVYGVAHHRERNESSIIVKIEGDAFYHYGEGDEIFPSIYVKEISKEGAYIEYEGELRYFSLIDIIESFGSGAIANSSQSDNEEYLGLRERLGLESVEDGMAEGYIITERTPNDIRSILDLEVGDVVLSLNGINLGIEENDMMASFSYQREGTAFIEVLRDGDTIYLSYP